MNIKISQFNQVPDINNEDLIPFVRPGVPDSEKNKIIEASDFKINSIANIRNVSLNNPIGGESLIFTSGGNLTNGSPKPFASEYTIYVSPNGVDYTSGTPQSDLVKPFASPKGAVNYLKDNGLINWHIIVSAGTYTNQFGLGYHGYWEFEFGAVVKNNTTNIMFEDQSGYVMRILGKGQFIQEGNASLIKFGHNSGIIIVVSSYNFSSNSVDYPLIDLYNYQQHTFNFIDEIITYNTLKPAFRASQDAMLIMNNIHKIQTFQSQKSSRGSLLETNSGARIDIRNCNFNAQGNCCVHSGNTHFLNYMNCRFVYGQDDGGISGGSTDQVNSPGGDNFPTVPLNMAFYAVKFVSYQANLPNRYPSFYNCLFITSDHYNSENINKVTVSSTTPDFGVQIINSASNRALHANVQNMASTTVDEITTSSFFVHPSISDCVNF